MSRNGWFNALRIDLLIEARGKAPAIPFSAISTRRFCYSDREHQVLRHLATNDDGNIEPFPEHLLTHSIYYSLIWLLLHLQRFYKRTIENMNFSSFF